MMMRPRALTAQTRFGLGPEPGLMAQISSDPLGYVYDQCLNPEAALIEDPDLWSRERLRTTYAQQEDEFRMARRAAREDKSENAQMAANAARDERRDLARGTFRKEVGARFRHSVTTDHPFVERLVLFWANHFAIDGSQGVPMRLTAGNFEREAIRPHVLGYFEDMLAAATTHPAMLNYLDNHRSIGPNSRAGRRRSKEVSVNENLARELLELHTLGAGSGYTQEDVVALAETLSGWVGGFSRQAAGEVFTDRFHEPGPRTILGKTYTVEGAAQLEAVLPDLATHQATARNIATKFARHFVADDVSPALIEELTDAFLVTGGDLRELAMTLIESDHAWAGEPKKTVPPYDFMVATMRATDGRIPQHRFIAHAARALAQNFWEVPSPAGWPDDDDAFLGGDSMLERVDFAKVVAERLTKVDRTQDLARDLFGDALDPFVEEAIARAEDQRQALVLLLMSPPFHRR